VRSKLEPLNIGMACSIGMTVVQLTDSTKAIIGYRIVTDHAETTLIADRETL
jgi:hypothetical protein